MCLGSVKSARDTSTPSKRTAAHRRLKPGVRTWAGHILQGLDDARAWQHCRGWRVAHEVVMVGADRRGLLMQLVQQHAVVLGHVHSLALQLDAIGLATPSLVCLMRDGALHDAHIAPFTIIHTHSTQVKTAVYDNTIQLVFGNISTNMRFTVQAPITHELLTGTDACTATLQWAGSSMVRVWCELSKWGLCLGVQRGKRIQICITCIPTQVTQASLDAALHKDGVEYGRHMIELVARMDALAQQKSAAVGQQQHTPGRALPVAAM